MTYPSLMVVVVISNIHLVLIFGALSIYLNNFDIPKPKYYHHIIIGGVSNAIMAVLFMFCSNTNRVSLVFQGILPNMSIFISVILSKLILKKRNTYILKYIIPSILFLIASISFSILPKSNNSFSLSWILLYILAIIMMCVQNIYQEKYLIDTNDRSNANIVTLLFFIRLFQLICVTIFSWTDIFLNNVNMLGSVKIFFTEIKPFIALELFIFTTFSIFFLAAKLNSISSNYYMIINVLNSPSAYIFYMLVPILSTGTKIPKLNIICSFITAILSVIFWCLGEKKENTYLIMDDI